MPTHHPCAKGNLAPARSRSVSSISPISSDNHDMAGFSGPGPHLPAASPAEWRFARSLATEVGPPAFHTSSTLATSAEDGSDPAVSIAARPPAMAACKLLPRGADDEVAASVRAVTASLAATPAALPVPTAPSSAAYCGTASRRYCGCCCYPISSAVSNTTIGAPAGGAAAATDA
jgi:hypothetical protein